MSRLATRDNIFGIPRIVFKASFETSFETKEQDETRKKKGTEAVDTLKEAYGESAIKPVTICKWVKRFQEERRSS